MKVLSIITIIFSYCVALGVGIIIGFFNNQSVSHNLTIYKILQTANTTYIGLEPSYQLNIKDAPFTWDNWMIEVK